MKYLVTIGFIMVVLATGTKAENIIFIGRPVQVELVDLSCDQFLNYKDKRQEERRALCLDRVFSLKYKVEHQLQKNTSTQEIQFYDFYHGWGMPYYVLIEPALVILKQREFGNTLSKIKEAKNFGGQWKVCIEYSNGKSSTEICENWVALEDYISSYSE